jgi:hypothetical protein
MFLSKVFALVHFALKEAEFYFDGEDWKGPDAPKRSFDDCLSP